MSHHNSVSPQVRQLEHQMGFVRTRLTQQRRNRDLKPLFELQVRLFDIMHNKIKHWINIFVYILQPRLN